LRHSLLKIWRGGLTQPQISNFQSRFWEGNLRYANLLDACVPDMPLQNLPFRGSCGIAVFPLFSCTFEESCVIKNSYYSEPMESMHQSKKRIIGYTSGVFDLFHVGHLRILQQAKSLCDHLIVGVTYDELVGYKNTKVVIPFEQRIEIIQNIRCVDLAVPQDHLDKYEMWLKLKFDVMFIGDDWFGTQRFKNNEKKLAEVNVKIIYLPYTQGISSSDIKEKIRGMDKT